MAKIAGSAQQRPVVVASDGEVTGRRS
jgi:hypothetical protein